MLKTIDEVREAEIEAGVVVNGIDNPNVLSVDSTEPIQTGADKIELSEDEKNELADQEPEEKEEVKAEEKAEEKVKAESEKEEPAPKPETDSNPVKKRIGDLTKKWRTAERERDFEREKRLEAEAKLKELATSSEIADSRPQKEDFDDEDDYIEALIDWKTEAKRKASQEQVVEEIENEAEKKAVSETYNGLDDAINSGKGKYKDFDDVVLDEDLVISPELTQILLDTDTPEDIMYYLGSNPDESARISELDPIRIAKEVGKIEVLLAKEEVKQQAKPVANSIKKSSSAPEPISPVRTTGIMEKDPNKMSPKEYRAWREKSSS